MAKNDYKIDLPRLCAAIHHARQELRPYREERREAVRQYCGSHWSENAARKKVPVNLLAVYVQTICPHLIAKNPRVLLSTFERAHKPMVSAMQAWVNKEVERIKFSETLQRIVLDALFTVGIAKVAIATPSDAVGAGFTLKAGAPSIWPIDLDDFVYDHHARDIRDAAFIGHRYRACLDTIKDSKLYSKARLKLTPSTDQQHNQEGDERIKELGLAGYGGDEEYEDYVNLWEIYLPRHRVVLTLSEDDMGLTEGPAKDEPLRTQEWLGPESGPYHFLSYGVVPGNAMPKGPIQDLVDLHKTVNDLYRKLIGQAERQKNNVFVQGGADADGNRVVNSVDGEVLRVDRPEAMKEASWGGPNQQNFLFAESTRQLFSWLAGNLDILGGRSPQSKTATQDRILNENAAVAISDMQERTINFVSDVSKALCHFWYFDPFKVMKSNYQIPGVPEISLTRTVTPEQRMQVQFEDLHIKIDPYSLRHASPQERLQSMMNVLTTVYAPMAQLAAAQGIYPDFNFLFKKAAEYLDEPDIMELLTVQEPPVERSSMGAEQPGMPAETTRNYVRENRSERTEQGNTLNLINALAGVDGGGAPEGNGQMAG